MSTGGYPYPIMLCNITQNAMGQLGGYPARSSQGGTLVYPDGGYPAGGWGYPAGRYPGGGYPGQGSTLPGGGGVPWPGGGTLPGGGGYPVRTT